MKITIAVGSTNPVKLAATRTVLGRAFPEAIFLAVNVESCLPKVG